MSQTKSHGGTRKGAGRKPSPNAYTPYPTRLPPHLLAWMRHNRKTDGTPVNQFIVQAIQEKIERTASQ